MNTHPDNIIKVKLRSSYGSTLVYPACCRSDKFAQIAGTKTLNDRTRALIKSLGYRFEQVTDDSVQL